MWTIPAQQAQHIYGPPEECEQREQHRRTASDRYVVYEVRMPFNSSASVNNEVFLSGFDRDDEWGYRALEPSRCCISSIALVLLKTGIVHSTNATGEKQVTIDYNQMATAQKLLLFWRKPAVSEHDLYFPRLF